MLTNTTITVIQTTVDAYNTYKKVSETTLEAYFAEITLQESIKLSTSEVPNKSGYYSSITATVSIMDVDLDTYDINSTLIKKGDKYYKIVKKDKYPMVFTGGELYLEEYKGNVY